MIFRSLLLLVVAFSHATIANAEFKVYQNLPGLEERVQEACSFLKTLYNPALGLVRETQGSEVYYIASDNLLAQKALETCDSQTSQSIRDAIALCCQEGHNNMHEALLGVEIPLPIRNSTLLPIANSSAGLLFNETSAAIAGGNYTVLWEMHNGTGTLSPSRYADVAAYTALQMIRQGNYTGASEMLESLNIMFDGQGLVDEPYQNGPPGELGIYQTYKLALYIHLQAKQYGVYPGLVERLLRMQGPEGGFHTGYDHAGTYAGTLANAETTSIANIILNQLTAQQTPPFFFPFFFTPSALSQLVFYQLIATAAGAAITLGFVYWDRRRARRRVIEHS